MIDELKSFIEVVKCKSFTKASKIVNLSQPTVSQHVKRLESHFDAILIKRSNKSKKIIITSEGRILYNRGREIIKELEDIKLEMLRSQRKISGKLKVGATLTIGEHFLPPFLKQFSTEYPELKLEIIIENTASICEKVKDLEVDIGLIEGLDPHYSFKREYFYEDHMVLVVSNNSELLTEPLSTENLQDQVWITREEGSGTREYLDLFLHLNNIVPRNIIILSSNYAVKEAVSAGLGITLISESVVKHAAYDHELDILPLEKEYTRKFSYIIPRNTKVIGPVYAFIQRLKTYKPVKRPKGAV